MHIQFIFFFVWASLASHPHIYTAADEEEIRKGKKNNLGRVDSEMQLFNVTGRRSPKLSLIKRVDQGATVLGKKSFSSHQCYMNFLHILILLCVCKSYGMNGEPLAG